MVGRNADRIHSAAFLQGFSRVSHSVGKPLRIQPAWAQSKLVVPVPGLLERGIPRVPVTTPPAWSGRRPHCPPLLKALAAVNWTTLCRLERDRGLFSALRTSRLRFGSLKTIALARSYCIRAFRFAGFASLGLVLEALVGEEHLFAGCEHKFRAALRALQNPVLVLHVTLRGPTLGAGLASSSDRPTGAGSTTRRLPSQPIQSRFGISRGLKLIQLSPLLLTQALTRKSLLRPALFTGLHVKTVLLDFLDNVLLLHLALETAQGVFKGLTFLDHNFGHAELTSKPCGSEAQFMFRDGKSRTGPLGRLF
jgi:hypothetical protein